MGSAAARTYSATKQTSAAGPKRIRAPVRANAARSQTIVIGMSSAGPVRASVPDRHLHEPERVSVHPMRRYLLRGQVHKGGQCCDRDDSRISRNATSRRARAISVAPRTNPMAPHGTTATCVPSVIAAKLGSVPAATRSPVVQRSVRFPVRAIQGPAPARTRRTSPTSRRARAEASAAMGSAAPVAVAVWVCGACRVFMTSPEHSMGSGWTGGGRWHLPDAGRCGGSARYYRAWLSGSSSWCVTLHPLPLQGGQLLGSGLPAGRCRTDPRRHELGPI